MFTAEKWNQLVTQRNVWIEHNFPRRSIPDPGESILGVIEELGELVHAHLKGAQSIRGTSQEHADAARDAVGDMTVYLLGVMSSASFVPVGSLVMWSTGTLFDLAQHVGRLARAYEVNQEGGSQLLYDVPIANVWWGLVKYCDQRNWDYDDIVQVTWTEVQKRDWIQFPKNGLTE